MFDFYFLEKQKRSEMYYFLNKNIWIFFFFTSIQLESNDKQRLADLSIPAALRSPPPQKSSPYRRRQRVGSSRARLDSSHCAQ